MKSSWKYRIHCTALSWLPNTKSITRVRTHWTAPSCQPPSSAFRKRRKSIWHIRFACAPNTTSIWSSSITWPFWWVMTTSIGSIWELNWLIFPESMQCWFVTWIDRESLDWRLSKVVNQQYIQKRLLEGLKERSW